MPVVLSAGLDYVGADFAEEAIAEARRNLSKLVPRRQARPRLVFGDVEDSEVFEEVRADDATLFALPFNVFGNLRSPWKLLRSISQKKASVLIFSFDVTEPAREVRTEYYLSCGLDGQMSSGPDGDSYHDGVFASVAHAPGRIMQELSDLGYEVGRRTYADAGVAISGKVST